jgi:hypothetical protein
VTRAQLLAITALADAIRSLGSVPDGHLYAGVMQHMALDAYTSYIDALVSAGLVTRKNNVLTWVGPQNQEEEK